MHGNFPAENRRLASRYTSGRASALRFKHAPTAGRTGYEAYLREEYAEPKFRAKRGFMLEAGALPTKPVQTASAATPLRRRRAAPTPEAVAVAAKATPRATLEQVADTSPELRATRPIHNEPSYPAVTHVDSVHADTLPLHPRRKRGKGYSMSLHSGIFAAIFTTMIAMVAGIFWSLKIPDNGMGINTTASASARARPAEPGISRQVASATSVAPQLAGPITLAGVPINSSRNQTPSDQNQTQAKGSSTLPLPEIQSDRASATSIASPAPPRQESAETTIVVPQKKYARANEKKDRSPRRNAATNRIDRADEISRLKAQAFSETRKDRLGSVKSPEKTSTPEARFDQSSARRTTEKSSRPTKRISVASEFNQCKRKESFLQQEKCKWQICAGKWGQNGCPSYKHDIASY